MTKIFVSVLIVDHQLAHGGARPMRAARHVRLQHDIVELEKRIGHLGFGSEASLSAAWS